MNNIKIMLVDDEPPFLEELRRIISEYGGNCEVVGEVYSGRQALELLQKIKPDIIFTDIRMPALDGIEFAKISHEMYRDIYIVVISGYASFDYAREAFRADVYDYLLKPVEQNMVNNVLNKIIPSILQDRYIKSEEILKKTIFTDDVDSINGPEPGYGSYSLIVVNAPLPELSGFRSSGSIQSEIFELIKSLIGNSEELWMLAVEKVGIVIILGWDSYREGKIKEICRGIEELFNRINLPVNVGSSGRISDFQKLRHKYKKLEEAILKRIIIGKAKIFSIQEISNVQAPVFMPVVDDNKLIMLVRANNWGSIKSELVNAFSVWEQKEYPSYLVEKALKQIITLFDRYAIIADRPSDAWIEKRIDEVVSVARSFGELLEVIWNIISSVFINNADELKSLKTVSIFPKIDEYIQKNLVHPISLLDISEAFGVSQSFICNLFRTKTGMSYVEYITRLRMEKAKELLSNPDFNIKDAASLVGYDDPRYFSRVFKNVTGLTPSEYQEKK